MEKVFSEAARLLGEGRSFVLATIIGDDRGGAPRSVGSKMLVFEDGSIYATIGGGSLELMAMNRAKALFETKGHELYCFNMTNKDASVADMVCGGIVDIYLNYIDADDPLNLRIFSAAAEAEDDNADAWVVYVIGEDKRYIAFVRGSVLISNTPAKMNGQIMQPAFGLHMHPELTDGMTVYAEPVCGVPTAYLFGAGHVSLYIAKVLTMIGFKTVVLDDRKEYANAERFPDSDIIVVDSMENIPPMNISANSYLIIVTRGHQNDRQALEYALGYEPAYIGMIGSHKKNVIVYEYLRGRGITQEQIDFVHAPIGLSIGAQTPEEIAVSIAAEIIQVKASIAKK